MDTERLRLIFADFSMDYCHPQVSVLKWKKEFGRISYSTWAVNELYRFITDRVYPKQYISVNECLQLIGEFIRKTRVYSELNSQTGSIFSTAEDVATEIQDIFRGML